MKILVYGAGAVGGYLGAVLTRAEHDVTLVTRQQTAEFIKKRGLLLSEADGTNLRLHPEVVTSIRLAFIDDQRYDLILLTMKSYDVEEALNSLVAFAPEPLAPVVTLQNGIGLEELVKKALNSDAVIAGSLTTPLSRPTPEQIQVERAGRGLALAPTQSGQKIKPWAELFTDVGIDTIAVKDHRAMKWSKALLNMMGNATSAIINRHPRVIYGATPTFELEMEMLNEALAVMKALKVPVVDLPGAPATRLAKGVRRLPAFLLKPVLVRLIDSGRGDKMPSFHMDLTAGKKDNEVVYHNGAVAAAGHELNVPTPVNAALTDILLKMARGEIDWTVYDGNPGKLVEAVERYKQQ